MKIPGMCVPDEVHGNVVSITQQVSVGRDPIKNETQNTLFTTRDDALHEANIETTAGAHYRYLLHFELRIHVNIQSTGAPPRLPNIEQSAVRTEVMFIVLLFYSLPGRYSSTPEVSGPALRLRTGNIWKR